MEPTYPPEGMPSEAVTRKWAADFVQISHSWVRHLCQAGVFTVYRNPVTKRVYLDGAEVRAYRDCRNTLVVVKRAS